MKLGVLKAFKNDRNMFLPLISRQLAEIAVRAFSEDELVSVKYPSLFGSPLCHNSLSPV